MIIFFCGRIPENIPFSAMTSELRRIFCNEKNEEYIREIEKTENGLLARERAGALLSLAYMLDELGIPNESRQALILKRNECGKPYFEGSDTSFSLSHSNGYVASVASDEGEVGIDIECSSISQSRAERISARFFGETDTSSPIDKDEFAREWTRCEAAAKLLGMSLAEYLKNKREGKPQGDGDIRHFEYTVDGYPLTICTSKMPTEIKRMSDSFDKLTAQNRSRKFF